MVRPSLMSCSGEAANNSRAKRAAKFWTYLFFLAVRRRSRCTSGSNWKFSHTERKSYACAPTYVSCGFYYSSSVWERDHTKVVNFGWEWSGQGGFFFFSWTRFENLVAKRRKCNDTEPGSYYVIGMTQCACWKTLAVSECPLCCLCPSAVGKTWSKVVFHTQEVKSWA